MLGNFCVSNKLTISYLYFLFKMISVLIIVTLSILVFKIRGLILYIGYFHLLFEPLYWLRDDQFWCRGKWKRVCGGTFVGLREQLGFHLITGEIILESHSKVNCTSPLTNHSQINSSQITFLGFLIETLLSINSLINSSCQFSRQPYLHGLITKIY